MSDNSIPQPTERRPRIDADKGREPNLITGRGGTRLYSLSALVEKVEVQFRAEYDADAPALIAANTPVKRLRLIIDVLNYVLAVESINLSNDDRAEAIQRVYSSLFGYGPLDSLLLDERITNLILEGEAKAAVRYGNGDLVPLGALFDDETHLSRIINRLLDDANAELSREAPFIEAGLIIGERPVRVSAVMPPYATALSVDIRVHPKQAPTLDDLVASNFMSDEAFQLLRKIASSKYGFCIVGETGAGKTTLLNAMLAHVPQQQLASVERALELRLGESAVRFATQWRSDNTKTPASFGEQILNALESAPECVVLDEVRSDEPMSIAPLLELETSPRLIWAVRGVPDSKRLQSALGMLARRANIGIGEALVHALYERIPFVITLAKVRNHASGETDLKLFSIAEWQSRVDSDYPDYVMLMQFRDGASRRTENQLARWVD
jgi:pilus assembly protein CpaF